MPTYSFLCNFIKGGIDVEHLIIRMLIKLAVVSVMLIGYIRLMLSMGRDTVKQDIIKDV